jgi:hypothetical protein
MLITPRFGLPMLARPLSPEPMIFSKIKENLFRVDSNAQITSGSRSAFQVVVQGRLRSSASFSTRFRAAFLIGALVGRYVD